MNRDIVYFIHIPKTAGTYVSDIFKPKLGDRFVREGHAVPSSCLRPWTPRFGPELFHSVRREDCIVFSVIRNPFDILVSMYSFGFPYWPPEAARMGVSINWPFNSFRDFIMRIAEWDDYPWLCPPQKNSIFFQLFDDGIFIPDFVIRQELLDEGIRELCKLLGLVSPEQRPKTNVSRSHPFQDYYDNEMKTAVEKHFAGDLAVFGYNFDGHDGRAIFSCDAEFDHQSGIYRRLPATSWNHLSPTKPAGALADVDLHPWGWEILSRFRARDLAKELLIRGLIGIRLSNRK